MTAATAALTATLAATVTTVMDDDIDDASTFMAMATSYDAVIDVTCGQSENGQKPQVVEACILHSWIYVDTAISTPTLSLSGRLGPTQTTTSSLSALDVVEINK